MKFSTKRYLRKQAFVVTLAAGCLTANSHADWRELFQKAEKTVTGAVGDTPSDAVLGELTNTEIIEGLKAALIKGTNTAIESLGRQDGFLGNPAVRIPLPEKLESLEKGLRAIGKGDVADDFIASMNRAAEQAVPLATDLFVGAISGMSLTDAQDILTGPDNAATQYLQTHSGDRLRELMSPIVQQATDKVGVTKAYKDMFAKAGMFSQAIDISSLDLDAYVTEQATNGLFQLIAAEEKRIRENPVARTTDILKKVFARQ